MELEREAALIWEIYLIKTEMGAKNEHCFSSCDCNSTNVPNFVGKTLCGVCVYVPKFVDTATNASLSRRTQYCYEQI